MLESLNNYSGLFSAITAFLAVCVSIIVYLGQKSYNKRQLIVPIWQYMSDLNNINPGKPISPHIIKVLNTLELIAISCERKVLDEVIVLRTFKKEYIKHYESIVLVEIVSGLDKSGLELLLENPATMAFYKKIKTKSI